MILSNTKGLDDKVYTCLQQALPDKKPAQIQSWMNEYYDPNFMFAYLENDTIASVLQRKPVRAIFDGKKLCSSQIILSATHPDYRQKKVHSTLINAALSQCENNELMTFCYSEFPTLFKKYGFQSISTTQTYWMSLHHYNQGDMSHVLSYNPNMDVYPTYQQFMSVFDGSILYSKQEFTHRLQAALSFKEKVVVMQDEKKNLCGFAIYSHQQNSIVISCLVYLHIQALQDLFAYLSKRCGSISLTISQQERLEEYFPMDFPREKGHVMVRLHDPKLFSYWIGAETKDAKQAFRRLRKPCWNHFFPS